MAQNPPQQPQTQTQSPTSGDVMRERISKAKAFIAIRNYGAAIYDLQNIRRETNDAAVLGVVNVLLMNSYLEQGDYKRAQDFLNETYAQQKTTRPNAGAAYMAVAGQVVKSARARAERYRSLGLSVSDRALPAEATNDLDKMRETLEMVITQAKEISSNKAKMGDAMALVEEASNSRSMIARDDYDARRWRDEVADTREKMANTGRVVLSAVDETQNTTNQNNDLVATNNKPADKPTEKPVDNTPADDNRSKITREREVKPNPNDNTDNTVAKNDKPVFIPSDPPARVVKEDPKPKQEKPKPTPAKTDGPIDVGSQLKDFATKQPSPVYPSAARSLRATGIVRVDVTVDENGEVAGVEKASGPALLQGAAKDAIRKWKFRPFTRDGQPVKATGYVSFNFAM